MRDELCVNNMLLHIDTTQNHEINIALKKDGNIFGKEKIEAKYSQAEKLLPAIDGLLKKNKVDLKELKLIEVENSGESFTALRIGVITANALAYALGIEVVGSLGESNNLGGFKIVEPIYTKEPNITVSKK